MRFLKNMLIDGERPLCRSGLHWVYLTSGFTWFASMAAIGWVADYVLWEYAANSIPAYPVVTPWFHYSFMPGHLGWMMTAAGAFVSASEFVKYLSTQLVVTTKRVIYKTGLIKNKVDLTDISDILGAHVDQGWFGQFFGYGKIHLDCRFIDDVYIPYIKNAYGVVRTIQKIKSSSASPPLPMDAATTAATAATDAAKPPMQPVAQTLIQISGGSPVYFVDKIPDDPKTSLRQLPKALGDNMLNAFRRKA